MKLFGSQSSEKSFDKLEYPIQGILAIEVLMGDFLYCKRSSEVSPRKLLKFRHKMVQYVPSF